MCFSASASFTACAVLMPLGLYSGHIAQQTGQREYVPLALTPFFVGVQQFVEGLMWTGIDNGNPACYRSLASMQLDPCSWIHDGTNPNDLVERLPNEFEHLAIVG